MSAAPYAPGQRIIVRDTEWVIRRVDLLRDGGYRLECDGVSSFVKGKEAIFLSSYEKFLLMWIFSFLPVFAYFLLKTIAAQ